MNKLSTKKYKPSTKLLDFIDAYWIIENKTDIKIDIPIVPDGCMDIIYQNQELLFVGAMDEGKVVSAHANDYSFGIRFKPAIFAHLVDKRCSEFTNKILPLQKVSPKLFTLLNFQEKNEIKKVQKLNTIFEDLFKNVQYEQNILHVIKEITRHKGAISISSVSNNLNISQRQLERLFLHYVGYSPKKFSNILRFFYVYKELVKTGARSLTSKAYDFGYYDQSHFNKEFKKFSNFSPTNEIMSIFYNTNK